MLSLYTLIVHLLDYGATVNFIEFEPLSKSSWY